MGWILCGMMAASLACGGKDGNGSSDGGPSAQRPNPCATMNRAYALAVSMQPGGTCNQPPFCDKLPCDISVNADGTISLPTNLTCASFTVTGCTTRGSNCTSMGNGESLTGTFEMTFSGEGITATGTISVTGTVNGQNCSSTYNVSALRQ